MDAPCGIHNGGLRGERVPPFFFPSGTASSLFLPASSRALTLTMLGSVICAIQATHIESPQALSSSSRVPPAPHSASTPHASRRRYYCACASPCSALLRATEYR